MINFTQIQSLITPKRKSHAQFLYQPAFINPGNLHEGCGCHISNDKYTKDVFRKMAALC
jgi:hypothetical protein